MIGDYFLNQGLLLTCAIRDIENEFIDFFVDLLFILEAYNRETSRDDFSLEFKEKFDLLRFLVEKRAENVGITFDEIIEDLNVGKYKEFIPYLKELHSENISKESILKFYDRVLKRRKIYEMIFSERELTSVLNDIKTENYESEDEILERYERLLERLYNNLIDNKNRQLCRQVSKLSLLEDDYTPVLNKLREVYDTKKSVKTGFRLLEKKFLSGGFEADRLYLVGGESGVGKSMFLINLICNALRLNEKNSSNNGKIDVFLYISAENYLHETFSRFYCCLNGISVNNLNKKVNQNEDTEIVNSIKGLIQRNNCNVKFYYYEPDKTTVYDIEALVKEIINDPKYNLKCVYIDYLDKISSGDFRGVKERSDNNRFEQGLVAKKFKLMANKYSIPVVTCTQLNRSGYNVDSNPDLTQMGESMIKINESDVVIFLQSVSDPFYTVNTKYGVCQYKKIRMTLLKNRNGAISEPKVVVTKQKINDEDSFDFRILELDEGGKEIVSKFNGQISDSNDDNDDNPFKDDCIDLEENQDLNFNDEENYFEEEDADLNSVNEFDEEQELEVNSTEENENWF